MLSVPTCQQARPLVPELVRVIETSVEDSKRQRPVQSESAGRGLSCSTSCLPSRWLTMTDTLTTPLLYRSYTARRSAMCAACINTTRYVCATVGF